MFWDVWVPQNVFFGRPEQLPTCVAAKCVLLEDVPMLFARLLSLSWEVKIGLYTYPVQAWRLLRHGFRRKERLWPDACFLARLEAIHILTPKLSRAT